MRISDWSSDVCSSDLAHRLPASDAVGDDARKRAQRLWTSAPHLNKKKGEPWDRLPFSGRFSYWWSSFMRYGLRCFSNVSGIQKTIRPKDRKRTRLHSSH